MRSLHLSALVLGVSLGATLGCGSKDDGARGLVRPTLPSKPAGNLQVTTTFPNSAVQSTTNTVHVWVLEGTGDAGTSCSNLVGGKLDPNDPRLERRGEIVSRDPSKIAAVSSVTVGAAFVYVEAVNYDGTVEYAGCTATDVKALSTAVTVTLGKAGVFDCTEADTKDGSPCDDGKLCTVGETCKNQVCQGGTARTCTGTTNECSAGTCDEAKGCVTTPVADDTPCDDRQACTTGDVCKSGQCTGKPRDCAAEAGACRTTTGCDELAGGCQFASAGNYGAACDDGLFCTTNDKCNFDGTCQGVERDCTNGGCATGTCNEALQRCMTTPLPTSGYCDDGLYCTTNDQCDGLGNCVGTPVKCSSSCATCSEASFGSCSVYATTGTLCTDGNPCTTGDQCTANGNCSGTTLLPQGTTCGAPCIGGGQCDDYGDCNASSYAALGTPCDDSDACTTGDECNGAGTCAGTTMAKCP